MEQELRVVSLMRKGKILRRLQRATLQDRTTAAMVTVQHSGLSITTQRFLAVGDEIPL